MEQLKNGWIATSHQPQMLGNGSDHEVGLGVGRGGRTLCMIVVSGWAAEQAPRACVFLVFERASCSSFNILRAYPVILPSYEV
jgi:hypothetical protein